MINKENDKTYLIKNSLITTIFRGLGVISGLILDAIILAKFGLSAETDAFFASLTIPFLISANLENEIPKILIPVLNAKEFIEDDKKRWANLSNIINTFFLILFSVSLFIYFTSTIIIKLQIPGVDSSVLILSVSMIKILVWIIITRGISVLFQSTMFSMHIYLFPALTKLISNLVACFLIMFLIVEYDIYSLPLSILGGSIAQMIFQICCLKKFGFKYSIKINFKDIYFTKFLKLLLLPLFGNGVSQIRIVVENGIASYLPTGSIALIRFANKIVGALTGVILGSVVNTTVPIISKYTALNQYPNVGKTLIDGIKILTFVFLPISLVLATNTDNWISLLFERGVFNTADVIKIKNIVLFLIPYIYFSRIIGICQIPFYAKFDSKIPFIFSVYNLFVNIFLILFTIKIFGIYCLPFSVSAATMITSIFLFKKINSHVVKLNFKKLLSYIEKCTILFCIDFIFSMLAIILIGYYPFEYSIYKKLAFTTIPTLITMILFIILSDILNIVKINQIYEYILKKNYRSR